MPKYRTSIGFRAPRSDRGLTQTGRNPTGTAPDERNFRKMPNNETATKRLRQAAKHCTANRSVKRELKTLTKRLEAHVRGSEADAAKELLPEMVAKIGRAGRKRILHPNTAARRKSRLTKLVNGL